MHVVTNTQVDVLQRFGRVEQPAGIHLQARAA